MHCQLDFKLHYNESTAPQQTSPSQENTLETTPTMKRQPAIRLQLQYKKYASKMVSIHGGGKADL